MEIGSLGALFVENTYQDYGVRAVTLDLRSLFIHLRDHLETSNEKDLSLLHILADISIVFGRAMLEEEAECGYIS